MEQEFAELGRYITGERDEFAVTVQAGDQVVAMENLGADLTFFDPIG